MKHVFILILLAACANPVTKVVNKAKYSAYEMVGLEKRDLFKKEVVNAKEEQEDTGRAFKDALTRLKEIYNVDGGNLEKQYDKLNSSYKDAQKEAADVKASIAKVDQVASDLFEEWENEIKEISSESLRAKSAEKRAETQKRFKVLHNQLHSSEKKIAPVLVKLKDQVLFLKHNLNAKAISGLKTEGDRIQLEIKDLMKDIEASTKEADAFIKTLD